MVDNGWWWLHETINFVQEMFNNFPKRLAYSGALRIGGFLRDNNYLETQFQPEIAMVASLLWLWRIPRVHKQ